MEKREYADLPDEVSRLRKLIDLAPHDDECDFWFDVGTVGRAPLACDCWKSHLGEEPKR